MPTDYARIKDPNRREHFAYILIGPRGKILYIGSTMNLRRRLREHRSSAWGSYSRVKAFGPYNHDTARALERRLIETHQPVHNTEWTKREQRGVAIFRQRSWSA